MSETQTRREARLEASRRTSAPPPRAGRPRRERAAPLPWHLRRSFLLPVIGTCLLGSLSGLAGVTGTAYGHLRAGEPVTALPDALMSSWASRTPVEEGPGTGRSSTASGRAAGAADADAAGAGTGAATTPPGTEDGTGALPAPEASAGETAPAAEPAPEPVEPGPGAEAAEEEPADDAEEAEPADTGSDTESDAESDAESGSDASPGLSTAGDVTYEGFGTAEQTFVDFVVDGEPDAREDLGATFSLPQRGSAGWSQWYVNVVNEGESGTVGCRIRDAGGAVLVERTAAGEGAEALCAWGDPDAEAEERR